MTGKEKCRLLKQIRKEIAESNGIVYLTSECTYEGECSGTCPKCDAEIKYLDSEIAKLGQEGKPISLKGLSLDTYKRATTIKGDIELAVTIEDMNLSVRTFNCLKRSGIDTLEDLCNKTEEEIKNIRSMRVASFKEICSELAKRGLSFRKEDTENDSPSIDTLELSDNAYNKLINAGISTIALLCSMTDEELLNIPNITIEDYDEIYEKMDEWGYHLQPTDIDFHEELVHGELLIEGQLETIKDKVLSMTIDELDFSIRTHNCLSRAGINTVADICNKTEIELIRVKNLGKKSLEEIIQKVTALGLTLREDDEKEILMGMLTCDDIKLERIEPADSNE